MKIRVLKTTVLMVAFLLTFQLSAKKLYIFFDSGCMSRLEFSNVDSKKDFIVYQVSISPNEKIVLKVGVESEQWQEDIPTPFLRCGYGDFDQNLVDKINSKIDEVYFVNQKGKKYSVSPIAIAGRFSSDQQGFVFQSPEYHFEFNYNNATIGENISKNNKATVVFDGKLENECSGAYLFRQTSKYTANPQANLVIVPEIGITEERPIERALPGFNSGGLLLSQVNGKNVGRYLKDLCQKGKAVPNEAVVGLEVPDAQFRPVVVAKKGAVEAQEEVQKEKFHTVAKGETLYSISRKYDVSVSEIRKWNNKGSSNLIRKGEKLKVSIPAPAKTQSKQATEPVLTKKSPVTPTSAMDTDAEHIHVVKAGETVASIALKYGYTEQKFREMNNLGKKNYLFIGQKVSVCSCKCHNNTTSNTTSQPTVENRAPSISSPAPYESSSWNTPQKPQNTTTTNPSWTKKDDFYEKTPYTEPSFNDQKSWKSNTPQPYNDNSWKSSTPQAQPYRDNSWNKPANTSTHNPSIRKTEIQSRNSFYDDTPVSPYNNNNNTYRQSTPTRNYETVKLNTPTPENKDLQAKGYDLPPAYETPSSYNYNMAQPAKAKKMRTHIVKEEETLYEISRRYGTTVKRIRELNNLEPTDIIIPYQTLLID